MGDELGESDGKRGCKRVREGNEVVSSDSTSTTDATTHGDATTKSLHALERANQELKEQVREAKKRESELVFRLTYKEKDIYNLEAHIKELVERSEKNAMHFRTSFMDPLVNRNFTLLQEKVTGLEKKLQTAHEDLQAVQFDPNNTSFAGKQLIARCRRLKEENEELGKKQAEGDSGPLKTQIKLQKSEIERLNAQLAEEWEFELELGEELNKLQEKLFQVEKGTGTGSTADEKTEQGVVGNASTTTVAATDIAKSASDSTEQKAPDVAVVTSSDSTEVKTTDAAMATASD